MGGCWVYRGGNERERSRKIMYSKRSAREEEESFDVSRVNTRARDVGEITIAGGGARKVGENESRQLSKAIWKRRRENETRGARAAREAFVCVSTRFTRGCERVRERGRPSFSAMKGDAPSYPDGGSHCLRARCMYDEASWKRDTRYGG